MEGPPREPDWRTSFAGVFAMQAVAAVLTLAMPVLGPLLTASAGMAPEAVGTISSVTALGTLWFLAAGNPILERCGAIRSLQLGALVGAAGLALALAGSPGLILVGAFAIGAGYGPSPPAGSEILARTVPRRHRALIFSAKQAAAPAGGLVAGLVLPLLASYGGWRAALAATALSAAAAAFLVQPLRSALDAGRNRGSRLTAARLLSPRNLLAPLAGLAGRPGLIVMSYCGFALACVQGAIAAFAVTFLAERFGLALADAALGFMLMQGAAIAARILMGWIADRVRSAAKTLAALSLVSAAALAGLAWATHVGDAAAAIALLAATGFFSASWNGIILAEVAMLARTGEIAASTSAATFFIFIGYALSPAIFGALVRELGGYGAPFAGLALLSLTVTLLLGSARRAGTSRLDGSAGGLS